MNEQKKKHTRKEQEDIDEKGKKKTNSEKLSDGEVNEKISQEKEIQK